MCKSSQNQTSEELVSYYSFKLITIEDICKQIQVIEKLLKGWYSNPNYKKIHIFSNFFPENFKKLNWNKYVSKAERETAFKKDSWTDRNYCIQVSILTSLPKTFEGCFNKQREE